MKKYEELEQKTGIKVANDQEFNLLKVAYKTSSNYIPIRFFLDRGLELSGKATSARFAWIDCEKEIGAWNAYFKKVGMDYSMMSREGTDFYVIVLLDFEHSKMYQGKTFEDVLSDVEMSLYKEAFEHEKQVQKDNVPRKGYGIMRRKDFAGSFMKNPEYLGEHIYMGKVTNNFLIDTKGKRHNLNSNYVTFFKLFSTREQMQTYYDNMHTKA